MKGTFIRRWLIARTNPGCEGHRGRSSSTPSPPFRPLACTAAPPPA
jgi:hypothetical protein